MSGILHHLIGFFVTISFVFVLLGLILFGTDHNISSNIQKETSEFVNEVCISGKVSSKEYLDFTKKIYACGDYEIQLTCDCFRAYPCKSETGANAYRIGTNTYGTYQVMKYMYPEPYLDSNGNWIYPQDRDFELTAGDSVTVTVIRKHSLASGFYIGFFHSSNSNTVITSYNNVVGYTYEEK